MFVRWKQRERTRRGHKTGKFVLSAVLVRSERREVKPRQKVVGYLGSIREEAVGFHYHRVGFWGGADRCLDSLGLDGDTRERVEAALATVVERPTAQSKAEAWARLNELEGRMQRRRRVL